jgi:hypothetical protein
MIIYKKNSRGQKIVVGCNYHTSWQNNPSMRFVLLEIYGNKARLATRTTRKDFWTNVDDLIFIQSKHNERKGKRLMKQDKKI